MRATLLNEVLIFAVSISGLLMALWCYLVNKKAIVNKIFSSIVVLIVLNIIFSYLFQLKLPVGHINWSLLCARMIWITASLLMTYFYFFSIYFPKKIYNSIRLDWFFILLGLLFASLSAFSNFLIRDVAVKEWGNEIIYGPAILFFYFALIGSVLISFIIVTKKYFHFQNEDKIRIKYLLTGFAIYIAFNIIFGILFPIALNTNQYSYLGDYSAIFFLGFTVYAIIKHQLFNIKVIATETTVVALSFGLLFEAFLSNNLTEGLLKGVVWILATYGGYVLVKSVKVEISQKEKLAKLASELESANTKLKELDEAKDNFLSMASHELNTPIAAISGYLSMIIDEEIAGKLNQKMKTYLTNVFVSSKRLAALVRDLLNVSRIESNRIHIIYTEGHIEDTIQQSILEIKIKADEVGHKLIFKKPEHRIPKFWFDQSRITEVIINFIGNAIKYTDPGGRIVVTAHADDKKVVVSVTDNGRGIPADRSNHIFEKFAQVDVLKDQVKGTGLGMFISKNLIEMHKGKIWFKSSVDPVDHGTTFYFSLPIIKEKPFDKFEGQGEVIRTKQQ